MSWTTSSIILIPFLQFKVIQYSSSKWLQFMFFSIWSSDFFLRIHSNSNLQWWLSMSHGMSDSHFGVVQKLIGQNLLGPFFVPSWLICDYIICKWMIPKCETNSRSLTSKFPLLIHFGVSISWNPVSRFHDPKFNIILWYLLVP